ncbi:MAG: hypothetical protein IPO38_06195 [Rhodocyclaceae bacterium]|nr:hypothetical protein [Rhodocyclaceae bacterium]
MPGQRNYATDATDTCRSAAKARSANRQLGQCHGVAAERASKYFGSEGGLRAVIIAGAPGLSRRPAQQNRHLRQ